MRASRRALRAVTAAAVAVAALGVAAPAPAEAGTGVWIHFEFDGCRWWNYADDGIGLNDISGAETRTIDVNGGCRRMKAYVRYWTSPTTTATKYCAISESNDIRCLQYGNPHHQSYGAAESWETAHWQNSGWWG